MTTEVCSKTKTKFLVVIRMAFRDTTYRFIRDASEPRASAFATIAFSICVASGKQSSRFADFRFLLVFHSSTILEIGLSLLEDEKYATPLLYRRCCLLTVD